MTTINDISDLVRILEERADWRAAVRNLLLGEDLLNLPQQLAQFIETTNENFRLVNEQLREHSSPSGAKGNFQQAYCRNGPAGR